MYNSNNSIFLMQSHSYFITYIQFFLLYHSYLFYWIWDPKNYTETKFRDTQRKPVLVFVLFCVVKEILCTCYPLGSISFRLLDCHAQSVSSGSLYIEWRRWVWLISDLTLWIRIEISLQEYLLVIDPTFLTQE